MSAAGTVIRALTPVGRGALLLVAVILLVFVAGRLGVRWDPFGLDERRLERAQARAVVAEAETAARSLEVEGARDQQDRLDNHHRTVRAAETAVAAAIQQSGAADDASVPLDPARADRLHAHDRELCRIVPDLDGCAAAPDPG